MSDPMGEGTCLATAGTCHHQQGALVMVHRPSLGVVKAGQKAHGWRLVVLRCLQRGCDGLPLSFDLTHALQAKVVDLVKSIPDKDIR